MEEVLHLRLGPGHDSFVGAIRQMTAEARPSVDFHVIRAGGDAVGFFKIDRAYGEDSGFAGPGDYGLRGMLIGHQYQGNGYGRAALEALPAYLRRRYPWVDRVRLTVNHRNPVATALYLACGWRDTDEVWDGARSGPQAVLELPLKPAVVGSGGGLTAARSMPGG